MSHHDIIAGELLDEENLSLEELARACAVDRRWVIERLESGLLDQGGHYVTHQRFTSHTLTRIRRMRQMEQDFDAVPELAALVADLLEEMDRLRTRARAAGVKLD
ncbi:chaperone modulator CbpM [Kushneria phosphatilytica]|uniref:MerR family transcriptional regulator n=1 Tax=Kushneria phosphatilytica TaxID=657387 RepID=A0A1S1NNY0_9GAMM|nr:chaperone modulator CbpM [Kushneria phosphatilytica]OHV09177.1 MerR family transcriptional regulator [Kushneria phosphatilytica]QEL12330.1 MerR family transcriptional regulator [Kushneria phosphatilytica]